MCKVLRWNSSKPLYFAGKNAEVFLPHFWQDFFKILARNRRSVYSRTLCSIPPWRVGEWNFAHGLMPTIEIQIGKKFWQKAFPGRGCVFCVPEYGDTPLCPRLSPPQWHFSKKKRFEPSCNISSNTCAKFHGGTVRNHLSRLDKVQKSSCLLSRTRFSLPMKYSIAQLTLIRWRSWQHWANMASSENLVCDEDHVDTFYSL